MNADEKYILFLLFSLLIILILLFNYVDKYELVVKENDLLREKVVDLNDSYLAEKRLNYFYRNRLNNPVRKEVYCNTSEELEVFVSSGNSNAPLRFNGSLLVAQKLKQSDEVFVGDLVVFKDEGEDLVMHAVTRIDNGSFFITKGYNNVWDDPWALVRDDLLWRYCVLLPQETSRYKIIGVDKE